MNKPVKLHLLTIIIRSAFSEDSKFYPQLFLDDALCDVLKCNMKKLLMMKELITIKIQVLQDFVCKFWFFVNKNFNYKDCACNGCHNLLMIALSLDNIAVLNVSNVLYRCILMGISKDESLKRLNNTNNLGKKGIV